MSAQTRLVELFGLAIVSAYPLPDTRACVPTGIVPNDDKHPLSLLFGDAKQTRDKDPHLFTVGLALTEVQVNLSGVVAQGAKTGQGFFPITAFGLTLDQLEWCVGQRLGMKPHFPALFKPPALALHQLRPAARSFVSQAAPFRLSFLEHQIQIVAKRQHLVVKAFDRHGFDALVVQDDIKNTALGIEFADHVTSHQITPDVIVMLVDLDPSRAGDTPLEQVVMISEQPAIWINLLRDGGQPGQIRKCNPRRTIATHARLVWAVMIVDMAMGFKRLGSVFKFSQKQGKLKGSIGKRMEA
jgi:hypothetical protein